MTVLTLSGEVERLPDFDPGDVPAPLRTAKAREAVKDATRHFLALKRVEGVDPGHRADRESLGAIRDHANAL